MVCGGGAASLKNLVGDCHHLDREFANREQRLALNLLRQRVAWQPNRCAPRSTTVTLLRWSLIRVYSLRGHR